MSFSVVESYSISVPEIFPPSEVDLNYTYKDLYIQRKSHIYCHIKI